MLGLSSPIIAYLAESCIALMAAGLMTVLNSRLQYSYQRYWVVSWYFFATYLALSAVSVYIGNVAQEAAIVSVAAQWFDYMRAYFLLIGTLVMIKPLQPKYSLHFILGLSIAVVISALHITFSGQEHWAERHFAGVGLRFLITGMLSVICAFLVYRHAKNRAGAMFFVASLAAYGVIQHIHVLESLRVMMGAAQGEWADGLILINVPIQACIAYGLVSWAVQDEHEKLAESETKLSKIALYDHLTGLLNRRGLDEQFSEKVHQQSAFVFFDLDRFKKVNDTYGHETGDWLLIAVSRLLQSSADKKDLTCRLGGDEFIWVIHSPEGKQSTMKRIQQFRESVANLTMVDGEPISISCSIGVSWFPDNATDLGELTRQSDQALYEAKGRGKNRIVVFS